MRNTSFETLKNAQILLSAEFTMISGDICHIGYGRQAVLEFRAKCDERLVREMDQGKVNTYREFFLRNGEICDHNEVKLAVSMTR